MGYQRQNRSRRSAGRGYETSQRKKVKARKQKHRSVGTYALEKNHVLTLEEVVGKTLVKLRSLGRQTFGLFPFNEYFDDWLVNLRRALSDFESSPAISIDEQFVKEYSQIISDVKRKLEERRREEAAYNAARKSLLDDKSLLERIDEEYTTRNREIEARKKSEIKRLSRNIQSLKEELGRIAQMKTGIFRSVSKEAKEQKEAEATQRLNSTQSELKSTVHNYTAEQEKLRNEYEKRKQTVIERIQNLQKEIDNLAVDGSLEARRAACEALVNVVNALLTRKKSPLHQTD